MGCGICRMMKKLPAAAQPAAMQRALALLSKAALVHRWGSLQWITILFTLAVDTVKYLRIEYCILTPTHCLLYSWHCISAIHTLEHGALRITHCVLRFTYGDVLVHCHVHRHWHCWLARCRDPARCIKRQWIAIVTCLNCLQTVLSKIVLHANQHFADAIQGGCSPVAQAHSFHAISIVLCSSSIINIACTALWALCCGVSSWHCVLRFGAYAQMQQLQQHLYNRCISALWMLYCTPLSSCCVL